MFDKNYNTFRFWWWLSILFGITAVAGAMTLTDLGSIWAIIGGAIAFLIVVWQTINAIQKNRNIRKITIRYLVPRRQYPNSKILNGAPEDEQYPCKLIVSIGVYKLFIQMISPIDLMLDHLHVSFEGADNNKPRIEDRDYSFIQERLKGGDVRDWWGEIHSPASDFPRPFYHQDCLQGSYKIRTYGQWEGKVHVRDSN